MASSKVLEQWQKIKALLPRDVRTYGMDRTDESDDLVLYKVLYIKYKPNCSQFMIYGGCYNNFVFINAMYFLFL